MFKKSKTKKALHGATFKGIKGKKVVQKKTLKVKGKRQVKQEAVKTPKQFVATTKAGYPGQKFQARIKTPTQKRFDDAAMTARIRAVTGSEDPC